MKTKAVIMKATGLCKSFANNGGQNHVLDMVNLEIYDGDFTVIMGSSGAGKSTLLYVLSGMDNPTQGEVCYRDRTVSHLQERNGNVTCQRIWLRLPTGASSQQSDAFRKCSGGRLSG